MPIGLYNEGIHRLPDSDGYLTRSSGRVSGTANPAIEWLIDKRLPVKATNPHYGTFAQPGKILAGADLIVSISGTRNDDMGYPKPMLTICNGCTENATESNGLVRSALGTPVGTLIQHVYDYVDNRNYNLLHPSLDRRQVLALPYVKDPYYADQLWYGCATGGATTTDGTGSNNPMGHDYSLDYRVSSNYALSAGDYVACDCSGHFVKWVPNTGSVANFVNYSYKQKIGQVLYIEELPYRGLLQFVMFKNYPELYDSSRPYPGPNGVDGRAFLAKDKNFLQDGYGAIDVYKWPEHMFDGMGLPGLTDGVRIAKKTVTETFTNQAVGSDGYHTITLTYGPVLRDETNLYAGSPSQLVCKWSSANNGTYNITLKEDIDFKVDRYNHKVIVLTNAGTTLAATDDYQITYSYTSNLKSGVPTFADVAGSCGIVYIATDF